MTLRARLFLFFGGLVALLVVGQWLLVETLTRDLSADVGEVAASVGKDVFSSLEERRYVRFAPLKGPPGEETVKGASEDAIIPELRGRRVAVVEVEEADGQTWIQDVFRLDPLPGQEEGQAAVVTYQLQLDVPEDARSLLLRGPAASREIPIPSSQVKETVEQASNRLMVGSLAILVAGLVVAAVVAHRVTAPLRGLAAAARSVGEGGLGEQAPETGGGEVRAAISSFNRMSSRLKELDETARRLRAREHLTELGEIARGLAHTLRNPLNALGLSLEELAARARGDGARGDGTAGSGTAGESTAGDGDADELVASARRQIRRIDQSIRSFLALASEGGGQVEEIDVHSLVQDVVLEVLQDSRHRVGIEVKEPDAPVRIRGVAPELRAVVQALVVNAVEASAAGDQVCLRVGPAGAERRVRIDIEDAGPGVTPEIRERLFTPHVTTKPNGSGMGLYLAHRIATTRYAGSIQVENREPRGVLAVLELADRERGADV
jgi:signal transduction histidine kinase